MTFKRQAVEVETNATVFERSKARQVIVRVEPSGLISFRLKGTQRTYDLMADAGYHAAVKQDVRAKLASDGKARK
jgi:hypothetical protein